MGRVAEGFDDETICWQIGGVRPSRWGERKSAVFINLAAAATGQRPTVLPTQLLRKEGAAADRAFRPRH